MIIGGGRIVAQGSRAELLAGTGTLVRAPDPAALGAALAAAGLAARLRDDGDHLVDAEPEVVGPPPRSTAASRSAASAPRTPRGSSSSSST